jgi:hypothetical protein
MKVIKKYYDFLGNRYDPVLQIKISGQVDNKDVNLTLFCNGNRQRDIRNDLDIVEIEKAVCDPMLGMSNSELYPFFIPSKNLSGEFTTGSQEYFNTYSIIRSGVPVEKQWIFPYRFKEDYILTWQNFTNSGQTNTTSTRRPGKLKTSHSGRIYLL